MPFPCMWRCVCLVRIDVSDERVTSIFRVENPASEEIRQQLVSRLNHQYQ
jgi:hypothetical protein